MHHASVVRLRIEAKIYRYTERSGLQVHVVDGGGYDGEQTLQTPQKRERGCCRWQART